MRYIRALLALWAIAAMMAVAPSYASDVDVCNGCSTILMQHLAMDKGNGDHYFYDLHGRRLVHYRVTDLVTPRMVGGSSVGGGGGVVKEIPLADSERQIYSAVQDFYDTYGTLTPGYVLNVSVYRVQGRASARTFKSEFDRNTDVTANANSSAGYINAFDMVTTPVSRQQIIDGLNRGDGLGTLDQAILGTKAAVQRVSDISKNFKIAGQPVVDAPLELPITVKFPDESSSIFKFNGLKKRLSTFLGLAVMDLVIQLRRL